MVDTIHLSDTFNHTGAETMSIEDLREEREDLVFDLGCGTAFPGSAEWKSDMAAEKALKEFDAKHPEVFATIQAERAANDAKVSAAKGWV